MGLSGASLSVRLLLSVAKEDKVSWKPQCSEFVPISSLPLGEVVCTFNTDK